MNTEHNDKNRSAAITTGLHHVEAELPGFALGCLSREASERVSAHLTTCASCRALSQSYEQTVGMLAFGIPQVDPPDELKDRLMRRIGSAPLVRSMSRPKRPRSFASLFQWFSPALAMACLVVIISLSGVSFWQWRQSRAIIGQMAAPLTIFKMRGTPLAPQADGTLIIGQNPRHGVLVASDLPSIQATQQFQLWLTRNGERVSGGTFSTTPMGYGVMQVAARRPLQDYQSATVTIEPAGGSPSPTGPELMSGVF